MTFIFRNRTIFWDISKWNRWQKKWDRGSNINYSSLSSLSSFLSLPLSLSLSWNRSTIQSLLNQPHQKLNQSPNQHHHWTIELATRITNRNNSNPMQPSKPKTSTTDHQNRITEALKPTTTDNPFKPKPQTQIQTHNTQPTTTMEPPERPIQKWRATLQLTSIHHHRYRHL